MKAEACKVKCRIEEARKVWVAYVNSDLTEGRGQNVPICVSEMKSTVERVGRNANVQGCDASVEPDFVFKVDGKWYGPVRLLQPTPEDAIRFASFLRKEAAQEKAKLAGLTDDDIAAIAEHP